MKKTIQRVGAGIVGLIICVGAMTSVHAMSGDSATNAALSCAQIKASNTSANTGLYWLQGTGMAQAKQYYCDMETSGGGWQLLFQRAGKTNNVESCGKNLNDFLHADCGAVSSLGYSDSYSSNVKTGFTAFAPIAYLNMQYTGDMVPDTDDAFIIKTTKNIFPNSTGAIEDIAVDAVCDINNPNNPNCDTTEVIWRYVGDSFFGGSYCQAGYAPRTNYNPPLEGMYAYCQDGTGKKYKSNGLFGNRSAYDETKLWRRYGQGSSASASGHLYMERMYSRSAVVNHAPTDINLSNTTVLEGVKTVGSLTAIDPEMIDTHTYTFATGAGSNDNIKFDLTTGGVLSFKEPPRYLTGAGKNTYTVRVQAKDSGTPAKMFEKAFTIDVTAPATSGKSFTTDKTPTKKTTTEKKTNKKTTETKTETKSIKKEEKKTTTTPTPTKTPTNPMPAQTYGDTNCADSNLDEAHAAYCFARKNAITTIDGYDNAMPMGNVYRQHFAKMMVNFSYNILNKPKVTTIPAGCTQYADMSAMDAEMQTYAQHACALGIMGVQADGTTPLASFGSDTLLTRAQFATVVSRVLRGKKYNAPDKNSTNWADAHLSAMNTHGYLTYITGDRPQTNEKRVFAWIVLHRIAKKK